MTVTFITVMEPHTTGPTVVRAITLTSRPFRALISDSFGDLYKDIHFAIPKLAVNDNNYEVFAQVLSEFKLKVDDLDKART